MASLHSILPHPLPAPPRAPEVRASGDSSSQETSNADPANRPPTAGSPGFGQFRPTALTSRYFYGITKRLWDILLLSLPLDLLLLLLPHLQLEIYGIARSELQEFGLMIGAVLFLGSALLWLLREPILDLLFALTHVQQRLAMNALWPVLTLVGIVAVTTVLELISHLTEINLASIVVSVLVLFGTVGSILKASRERRAEASALIQDPTGKVERANQLMGSISLIPLGATRLGSLVVVFTLVSTGGGVVEVLLVEVATLLLFLGLRPNFEQFSFACVRCGILTSRALKGGSLCPMCLMARRDEGAEYASPTDALSIKILRKAEKLSRLAEQSSMGATAREKEIHPSDVAHTLRNIHRIKSRQDLQDLLRAHRSRTRK